MSQMTLKVASASVSNVTQKSGHSNESKSSKIRFLSGSQRGSGSQKGIFFLISRKVTITYGPYSNLGILDYRTERFEGLMKALKKVGGEPVLKPYYHVNRVRVWHLEHEIFSCAITDLQHGGDGDMDRLCIEAARALDRSARKAHYNLRYRYKLERNLNATCPCHPDYGTNDESEPNLTTSQPRGHHGHHHGHGRGHHGHHSHNQSYTTSRPDTGTGSSTKSSQLRDDEKSGTNTRGPELGNSLPAANHLQGSQGHQHHVTLVSDQHRGQAHESQKHASDIKNEGML